MVPVMEDIDRVSALHHRGLLHLDKKQAKYFTATWICASVCACAISRIDNLCLLNIPVRLMEPRFQGHNSDP